MQKSLSPKNKLKRILFGIATLGLVTFVGTKAGKVINNRNRDEEEKKEEAVQEPQKPTDFTSLAMAHYYPELFIAVEELETYRATPKKHTKEKRYTYWNGLTWVYTVAKNGKIVQHPCVEKWKDMAAGFSREQCEEQFRLHLQFETFKSLEMAISDKSNINHQQIMGLLMLGYQLPGKMAPIANHLNKATNTQQIMDAFKHSLPENTLWREGTLKRRWWCGAYAAGLVTVDDLLNLKKDAFSKISLTKVATGIKKNTKGEVLSIEHFRFDTITVQYALNTARIKGNNPIVRDVLDQTAGGRAVIKAVESGTTIDFIIAKSNFDQTDYAKAVTSFRSGDYESAAAGFKKLLETNPNDALLWNDLAASYNNLGKYDLALECTGKIFKEIGDRSQYAAAYYNAGVARENLGQYESALANYQYAKKNGNKSPDVDAGIARVQKIMAKSAKMRAYNTGTQKVGATMQHHKLQNIRTLPKTGARRA